ncbi:mycothione reductase [Ornithinimicrobium sp. EGI L100131]|nr:mycothione reductase [Ornithinimicrobium sediminis]MCE0486475.1 mycothione reductase [Ornithinimicrobium sediminis]
MRRVTSSHYDLVIIGTGSGNSLVTPDFADKRVAVVEEGVFGGTCLNVGCIPTKMFVYAAEVATSVRESARFGVDATLDRVRWDDIRDRVFGRIDPIAEAGRDYRVEGPNTTAYLGRARFTGERELEVTGLPEGGSARITGDQVVIATGARPWVPDEVLDSGVRFHTSDTVMRMEELPESMLILGGGYIASEFAHILSALGVRVSLATRGSGLLRHLDDTVSAGFTALAQQHWDVHLGVEARAVTRDPQGVVRMELTDGSALEAQELLVATGRQPNSDDMGLEALGVRTDRDGRVLVDEHGRTGVEGVWAMGDVSSPYQLKHVANHEARVLAHNLAHPQDLRSFDHRAVPAGVFSHPQLASVGLTERQAREAGHDVTVKVQMYGDTAYGWAMEDSSSLCKLVADRRTRGLLGAHLMGPHATSLIQPLIEAVQTGRPVDGLARTHYWIHPALSEVVENALLGLDFTGPYHGT